MKAVGLAGNARATFGENPLEFGFRDCGGGAGLVR
jgi:hypothetical protein